MNTKRLNLALAATLSLALAACGPQEAPENDAMAETAPDTAGEEEPVDERETDVGSGEGDRTGPEDRTTPDTPTGPEDRLQSAAGAEGAMEE